VKLVLISHHLGRRHVNPVLWATMLVKWDPPHAPCVQLDLLAPTRQYHRHLSVQREPSAVALNLPVPLVSQAHFPAPVDLLLATTVPLDIIAPRAQQVLL
jgi:hypothetical protein